MEICGDRVAEDYDIRSEFCLWLNNDIAIHSMFVTKALGRRQEQQLDGPILGRLYKTRFDALILNVENIFKGFCSPFIFIIF